MNIERTQRLERDPLTGQYPGGIIETKEFFRTSEFWVLVSTVFILMMTAAGMETLDAGHVALLSTVLGATYILSRGIAKAGSAHPFWGRERPNLGERFNNRERRIDIDTNGDALATQLRAIEQRLDRLERTQRMVP